MGQNVQMKIEDPSSTISPQIKSMLEKLLGFDNIPRKQKPFTNFVKNSLKMWDNAKINELWEVISAATAAPKPSPAEPAKAPAASKRKWQGWKSALDDELREAGGALPWKRLRDSLVVRYREGNNGQNG